MTIDYIEDKDIGRARSKRRIRELDSNSNFEINSIAELIQMVDALQCALQMKGVPMSGLEMILPGNCRYYWKGGPDRWLLI